MSSIDTCELYIYILSLYVDCSLRRSCRVISIYAELVHLPITLPYMHILSKLNNAEAEEENYFIIYELCFCG